MKRLHPKIYVLFLMALLSSGSLAWSQSTSVMVYSNYSLSNTERNMTANMPPGMSLVEDLRTFQLGYFTPAISLAKANGNYQEFEFSRLLVNRSDGQLVYYDNDGELFSLNILEVKTNVMIAFRYEYNWNILRSNPDAKFRPYIGCSALPYYSNTSYLPSESNQWSSRFHDLGATLTLTPRLVYHLDERWFLDLNIPISFMDLSYSSHTLNSANLPIEDRTTSSVSLETFPSQFLIRFGVGVKL